MRYGDIIRSESHAKRLGTNLILLFLSTDWKTSEAHHCDRKQELGTVMTKMVSENVYYATE